MFGHTLSWLSDTIFMMTTLYQLESFADLFHIFIHNIIFINAHWEVDISWPSYVSIAECFYKWMWNRKFSRLHSKGLASFPLLQKLTASYKYFFFNVSLYFHFSSACLNQTESIMSSAISCLHSGTTHPLLQTRDICNISCNICLSVIVFVVPLSKIRMVPLTTLWTSYFHFPSSCFKLF